MKNLLLIRHMDKEEPVAGALYGRTDLPLKEAAFEKFSEVKESLIELPIGKVLCSPLKRCRQTAEYYFPSADLELIEEAQEVDFGSWDGLTFEQIKSDFPDEVDRWAQDSEFQFPNGESLKDFRERVERLLQKVRQQDESTVALVTHGGVIRIILCHILGLEIKHSSAFKFEQGLITHIELFENGLGVLNKINDFGDERWLRLL